MIHTLLWKETYCQRLLYTLLQGHLLHTSFGLVLSGLKVVSSGATPSPASGVSHPCLWEAHAHGTRPAIHTSKGVVGQLGRLRNRLSPS